MAGSKPDTIEEKLQKAAAKARELLKRRGLTDEQIEAAIAKKARQPKEAQDEK